MSRAGHPQTEGRTVPPRKAVDAEAVTPTGAALGNVDAASLLDDIADTQTLILKQEALIRDLAAQVAELREGKADNPVPPQQAVYEPPVLREGHKRYTSRYTEHTMMRVGEGYEMRGGQHVPVPIIVGKPIDFNGGVYETGDPDEIEFIENHPDFGTVVWEDPTAERRHSSVEVRDGMRGTESSPRVPLSAPMSQ